MVDDKLTSAEERYLEDLKNIPKTIRSRLIGWSIELVPSTGLFAYGIYSDKRLFVILGFLSLLYFAVWRMYSQFRGFRMLSRIYETRLAETNDR